LSDISNLLGEDWIPLASELGITTSDVNLVKSECPNIVAQQAMSMLRLWLQQAGNKATGKFLRVNVLYPPLFTATFLFPEVLDFKPCHNFIKFECFGNTFYFH
jgi:hypothetical protein